MNNRHWTEKEHEYLSDHAGYLDMEQLCRKLNRTRTAIKIFMKRHGITFHGNVYTFTLVSKELGKSRTSIRKYYNKGLINGRRATWKSAYGSKPMLFTLEDIEKFCKERYYLLDPRKITNPYFCNIVRDMYEKQRNSNLVLVTA